MSLQNNLSLFRIVGRISEIGNPGQTEILKWLERVTIAINEVVKHVKQCAKRTKEAVQRGFFQLPDEYNSRG